MHALGHFRNLNLVSTILVVNNVEIVSVIYTYICLRFKSSSYSVGFDKYIFVKKYGIA